MANPYFQEELEYLRELGREFARENPTLAPMLAERGSDPDVERVLEGTAFLTGLVRQRLDDDLPELTQTLLEMLWPHYLRPLPSLCVVEFSHPAKPKVGTTQRIPRDETELESVPVDGTPCRFRTCSDVDLHPLRVADARLDTAARGSLRVRFEVVGNAKLEEVRPDPLRLYLAGDVPVASLLRLWLLRHVRAVELEIPDGQRRRRHPLPGRPTPVRAVGFAEDEGLLPYPRHAFLGYRLLQEYFALPQKFLFVDVAGIPNLKALGVTQSFELVFHFSERPPDTLRVDADALRLHCTPAVNLRAMNADPIVITPDKRSYMVRPADPEPGHFEVYSVDSVIGLPRGRNERREYEPFYAFRQGLRGDRAPVFYQTRRRQAVGRPNSDVFLSFLSLDAKDAIPEAETISLETTCTNRTLAEGLHPGDVRAQTDRSPQFCEFRNLTAPTRSVLPALEGALHWGLISHLALNFSSLASLEGLRAALRLYAFHASYDRQAARALELRLGALASLSQEREERLFRGAPVRGMHARMGIDEEGFSSEGELYLFASVLEEFLALAVTLNGFSRLTVRGTRHGEEYAWSPRLGRQIIL